MSAKPERVKTLGLLVFEAGQVETGVSDAVARPPQVSRASHTSRPASE
jgi:hypothetical protein